MKTKNPFSPIELSKSEAKWFIDYLEGKNKDPEAEKYRKETLKKASGLKGGSVVCL